jgi:hypothetical protein
MFRVLLLVHRYLGIALGILVALWCLSAFVMMYVRFPDLTDQEHLAGLSNLDMERCCQLDIGTAEFLQNTDEFNIEMMGDLPVLRTRSATGLSMTINLVNGSRVNSVDEETAKILARQFFVNKGIAADTLSLEIIERDQWTVAGGFDALRPFYRFAAGDDAGSQIYVSSVTGELVQDTTRHERFWNWLGAVVHWIYPTVLRQHAALWANVIVWTTIASLFLVVIGLYIGVIQFGLRNDGRLSPYRGITLWHHYTSLIFGLLTLTWLLSGLFSVNPWGLLEGDSGRFERDAVRGMSIGSNDIVGLLDTLDNAGVPPGTVRLRSAPFDGELAVLAYDSTSRITRFDGATLMRESLPEVAWTDLPRRIRPDSPVLDAGWIEQGDRYYYSHHESVSFPAYRIIFNDADQTRYYFEAQSGQLVSKVDKNRRWHRWLFLALHRGDLSALLRSRPVWDLLLLPLLLGVTIGAVTGAYLGIRRLLR